MNQNKNITIGLKMYGKMKWILLAIFIAVVIIITWAYGDNSKAYDRSSRAQSDIISTIKTKLVSSVYVSNADKECVPLSILEKRCTFSQKLLFADRNITRETFENFLHSDGWVRSSNESRQNFFAITPIPQAVIQSDAHAIRNLNDNRTGQAISSRINVYESTEVPQSDGKPFYYTGFSYDDEHFFELAKQSDAARYFVVTVETDANAHSFAP